MKEEAGCQSLPVSSNEAIKELIFKQNKSLKRKFIRNENNLVEELNG